MNDPLQLGRYRIVRRLATGGMAEVFVAEAEGPLGFRKPVVIKRILPHLAEDPAFVEMLLNEARLVAQLNHPQIVQIFELAEHDGTWFIAMEFIEGHSLRGLLKRSLVAKRPLPVELAVRMVSAACPALQYAHDFKDPVSGAPMQLVHRDVSPENILVSFHGVVKVVDFGIARAATLPHLTRTGTTKGKVAYMPPEQLRGEELDRRADVYALAVTLYELLVGKPPYTAPHEPALIHTIVTENPRLGPSVRADVPDALWRVIERALSKNRGERFADATALRRELEDVVTQSGKPASEVEIAALVREYDAIEIPRGRKTGPVDTASPTASPHKERPEGLGQLATVVDSPAQRRQITAVAEPQLLFVAQLEGHAEKALVRLVARYGEVEVVARREGLEAALPTGTGIVVSRDAKAETEAFNALEYKGLSFNSLLGRFTATGDLAVQIWSEGPSFFPGDWDVRMPSSKRVDVLGPPVAKVSAQVTDAGFEVQISITAEGEQIPIQVLRETARSGRRFLRLAEKKFCLLDDGAKELAAALEALNGKSESFSVSRAELQVLKKLAAAAAERDVPAEVSAA